jgi:hypothetical protein
MARAVKNHGGDRLRLHTLGLGEVDNVVLGGRIEIDNIFRIARANRDLVHIDIGRMQKRALLRHSQRGDGSRHILGAQRRALQRIDGDIEFGPNPVPTFSPMNSIGASSISPSPMTTVPLMASPLSSRRMASTAA